ncbi:MAG: YceI family protein [Trueperaceae bacterium]|nr:YceI family protein [Trueperaceae bacterium]MCW5819697.1 YceI family protein [Trueperaceae bacterium]
MTPLKRLTRLLLTVLATAAFAVPAALAAPVEYVLDPTASQASFLIGENLLGRENTAVGTTNVVTGGVSIDGDDPTALSFQVFTVDVSTVTTDDRMRDGQIRNNILQTNRAGNATVTFAPASVEGLELPLVAGTTQTVRLTGDLTIKGVTRTVVFDLDLEVVSDGELRGTASTVVKLTDFDISVPRVPLVARVDEDVQLVLDFRLVAGEE